MTLVIFRTEQGRWSWRLEDAGHEVSRSRRSYVERWEAIEQARLWYPNVPIALEDRSQNS